MRQVVQFEQLVGMVRLSRVGHDIHLGAQWPHQQEGQGVPEHDGLVAHGPIGIHLVGEAVGIDHIGHLKVGHVDLVGGLVDCLWCARTSVRHSREQRWAHAMGTVLARRTRLVNHHRTHLPSPNHDRTCVCRRLYASYPCHLSYLYAYRPSYPCPLCIYRLSCPCPLCTCPSVGDG
jgi:hypothetical protein